MAGFLYKPIGQGQVSGGRATFVLENTDLVSGGWYDSKGNLVERFNKFQGTPENGAAPSIKFYATKPGGAYGENLTARFTDSSGKVYSYNIANGNQRYEGSLEDPNSLKAVNKGPVGVSGAPGAFQPGQAGDYGAVPAYIGGMFPTAVLANYTPIQVAPYQFTDPMKYAEKFGAFNRKEIQKNFDQSKDLALNELDTELSSLQHFVPAASALKRQETSLDNQFNQAQRTAQVDQALPGVGADLTAQAARARDYAAGKIPDAVANQGFELGVRSAAADQAAGGGFGAGSSVARKASDLLSATQRVNLSRYGDQLLTNNINEKAQLYLAPTEYSNAGSQIAVMPSLSSSQLINSNLNAINGLTTISPAQGLQSTTQQNQFTTGLQQQTNQFNATNQLQLSEFNAGTQNQFALDKFGYEAGYANSVASGAQTNINTALMLQQQQLYNQLMQQYMSQAQNAGMLQSLLNMGGSLLSSGALSSLTNFGSGAKAGASGIQGPQTTAAGEKGMGTGSFLSSALGSVGSALGF